MSAVCPWSVAHPEYRTVLRPRLPVVVDPRSTHVRVAKPLLDLRDVGALVERVGCGGGAGRVRPEPVNADADLCPVEFQNLMRAVRGERRIRRPPSVIPNRLKEGRRGEGAVTGRLEVFGDLL